MNGCLIYPTHCHFMTDKTNNTVNALPKITMLVPPRVVSMMTGCERAELKTADVVTLVYVDGSEESAPVPNRHALDFFGLVSAVQSQRK